MPEKKKARVLVTTPAAEAIWPKLHEPDTKWKAEGEYSVKMAFDPADEKVKPFLAHIEALVDESFAKAQDENPKFKKVMTRVSPTKPELDDNGDETGRVALSFKKAAKVTSKKNGKTYEFRPMLYDATLAPLPSGVKVGGGSVIRVSFEPYAYFSAKDKEAGISLRLEAVQVLELRSYERKSGASFGFGREAGFDSSTLPAEVQAAIDDFEATVPATETNGSDF